MKKFVCVMLILAIACGISAYAELSLGDYTHRDIVSDDRLNHVTTISLPFGNRVSILTIKGGDYVIFDTWSSEGHGSEVAITYKGSTLYSVIYANEDNVEEARSIFTRTFNNILRDLDSKGVS